MKHDFNGASSMIEACRYDAANNALIITFSGGKSYKYADCPEDHFHGLKNAKSAGQYFAANIRGKFKHEMLV